MTTTSRWAYFKNYWYLWLFPLFAVLISGWLFAEFFKERGPMIQILFQDASSLQPEKTKVRYRGVEIGLVKEVVLSKDMKSVVARIRLHRDAKQFAVEGSQFWIVMPKVGVQGITGLETIFDGTYISVSPGSENSQPKYQFIALANVETQQGLEETVPFLLENPYAGSLSVGDPILFRGLRIGSITSVELSKNAQKIIAQMNIDKKYTRLIRSNTIFWRKLAVEANLGLFNSELKLGSLDSLLNGGIECFTPTEIGERAKARTAFILREKAPKEVVSWHPSFE